MVLNLVSGIFKSIKSNSKVHSLEFSTKYNTKTLCTFFFASKIHENIEAMLRPGGVLPYMGYIGNVPL